MKNHKAKKMHIHLHNSKNLNRFIFFSLSLLYLLKFYEKITEAKLGIFIYFYIM
jgi:hypothetical protein